MLVIAPMPVNVIHDEFVMGSSCRARVLVPAFPMAKESCDIVSIDEPAVLAVDEPVKTEHESGFTQDEEKPAHRTDFPKKKSNVNIGTHVKGDFYMKKIDATMAFRPAVPVTGAMKADVLNYEKNVVKHTYLIALLLFLLVIFIGGVVFATKHFFHNNRKNINDHAGNRYVKIASPSYSHLKDQYGNQVKADQQQAKRTIENLTTQIVRDVNENSGQ